MPDRRASPWAVVGCPVGAQRRDCPGTFDGGTFGLLRSLPADHIPFAASRLGGLSPLFPSRTDSESKAAKPRRWSSRKNRKKMQGEEQAWDCAGAAWVVPLLLCLFAILAAKAVFGLDRECLTQSREGEPLRHRVSAGAPFCSMWRRNERRFRAEALGRREGQGTAFVRPPRSLRLGVKTCSGSFAIFAASREVVLLTPR